MSQPTAAETMKQLITLRLGAAGFGQHWKHCDLVANYLATFTSELLNQTEAHANLVSTVLNELLEIVFRRNAGQGQICITLTGDEAELLVRILVPVDQGDLAFYGDVAAMTARTDVHDLHCEQLEQPAPDERNLSLGLLELAAVYGAVLKVTPVDEESAVLLELPFQVNP